MRKLEVRNVPEEGWCDKDVLAFHAVFTCLCDYVEEEHDDFEEHICLLDDEDLSSSEERETLDLYKWYTSTQWDTEYTYLEEHADKLERAVKVMGSWWT